MKYGFSEAHQEIMDLIAELESIAERTEDMEDWDSLIDELEGQSGTVTTIIENMRKVQ